MAAVWTATRTRLGALVGLPRGFASFLAGLTVSKLGDSLYMFALPWVAYELTGSSVVMGTLYATEIIPILLFGALIGVFVDRWDRRKLMLTADVVRAVLVTAIPLLHLTGQLAVWHLFVAAFALSLVSLAFDVATTAVMLGLAVPLVVLLLPMGSTATGALLGAGSALVGGFGAWLVQVLAGQGMAVMPALAYKPYSVAGTEIAMVVGVFALVGVLYALATPRHAAARVYRALALAHHQPTIAAYGAESLDGLRESLSAAGAADLLPLVEQMAGGLAANPDLQDLTVEYCRLFYGPGKLIAPPYESVYLGGGVLMGEPTLAVQRRYAEAGVQVWEGFRDCPDHMAAELEYPFFTAREAANFAALGREATAQVWARRHREFLTDHLASWVKPFAAKALEGSQNGYYRSLVELTRQWVERQNKSH